MIDWSRLPEMMALGSAGALTLEVIRVYELRGKLHHKKYQVVLRSTLFWVVAFGFILGSGFLAWAFNESNANASPWQLVITGMGASALAKKVSEALVSGAVLDAGESDLALRDLFR